jgi:hypothetical protein
MELTITIISFLFFTGLAAFLTWRISRSDDWQAEGKIGQSLCSSRRFCLEARHFPDSPDQANFPSTILKPGEQYKTQTVCKFSAK